MVSFSVRKIRKNIIKSNFVLFALLFAISCSDSSNTEQKIDKQKTYNWSLVTTWYGGKLVSARKINGKRISA